MDAITTKFITKQQMPLVIEPTNSNMSYEEMINLLQTRKEFFKSELLKYGALLFRNFPVKDEDAFAAIIKNLDVGKFIDYIGGDSPRNKVKEGIYTSTEAPPSVKIPLHNELSFVQKHPSHIHFYCAIAPENGGETIIGDARKIYKDVDNNVKKRFVDNGLKYVSCYYHKSQVMEMLNRMQRSHKSWIDVFETRDKQDVEKKCRDNNFGFKWNQHDWLKISQDRPAMMNHPITNEPIWFNQAHLYDFNPRLLGWWRYFGAKMFYCRDHMKLHEIYYGNGTKIPRQDLYHVLDVLDKNTVYFKWQKGDVMIMDNVLAMHGRATFTGKRRILTAMTG